MAMVMLGNGLLDDKTGATGPDAVRVQLQIQAQMTAALNRRVAHTPQEWANQDAYFPRVSVLTPTRNSGIAIASTIWPTAFRMLMSPSIARRYIPAARPRLRLKSAGRLVLVSPLTGVLINNGALSAIHLG